MRVMLFLGMSALLWNAVLWNARGAEIQNQGGGWQTMAPDFHLILSTPRPEPGREVTVALVGLPAGGMVRWNVSGSPVSGAGVKPGNAAEYTFIPSGPGAYSIIAELSDARGMPLGASSMDITIGGGMSGNVMGATPALATEMHLAANPQQPKVGQEVTFTFRLGAALPAGSEVRWNLSGDASGPARATGAHKENCTFVPRSQSTYKVTAGLYDAGGALLGEVTLAFIPL